LTKEIADETLQKLMATIDKDLDKFCDKVIFDEF